MLPKFEKIDPRIKRTRQLILQAFMDLIRIKTFQAMTVQDITERAGINRATFYAHFVDKYDLQEQAIGEWFQGQLVQALKLDEGLSSENLQALIEAVYDFLSDMKIHCHPVDKQYSPLIESQVQIKVYELLFSWLDRYRPKADIEAMALSWAIFGLGLRWSKGNLDYSKAELSKETLRLVEMVLGAEILA